MHSNLLYHRVQGYPSGQDKPPVDLNLRSSGSWWSAIVSTYVLPRQDCETFALTPESPNLMDDPVDGLKHIQHKAKHDHISHLA